MSNHYTYYINERRFSVKNKVLLTITAVMILIQAIGASALDSDALTIPTLMVLLPLIWLIPFALANKER